MLSSESPVLKDQSSVIEEIKSPPKPIYHKPKTSLFLEKATMIQSGAANVLESQGNGYLSS